MGATANTDALRKQVERTLRALVDGAKAGIAEAATQVQRDEKARINRGPVAPHLQDLIEVNMSANGAKASVGATDPAVKYAVFIEWGRANAEANPYARPAAALARREAPRTVRRNIDEHLRGVL